MSRRDGLSAIRDATLHAAPAIHVLVLDGVPRVGLTPTEVAKATGLSYRRILAEINAGRIRVITGSREYIIPAGELVTVLGWAERLDPTA